MAEASDDEIEALIRAMVVGLCSYPAEIVIRTLTGSEVVVLRGVAVNREVTVYEVTVAQDDVPKVIGRGGAHVKAMRTLLEAAATRLQRRVQLELNAPVRARW